MRAYFDIIIPVYNQVGKMDNCIRSLKEQTFGDFRAIFVNDGSRDASLNMLNAYAREDERFTVTGYETNGSLVKARFTGMQQAEGAYVLFLDSDDYLSADALEKIKEYADKNPCDLISFGFISEPQGIERPAIATEDMLLDILEDKIRPSIWKNAYSGALIKRAAERISPFYCNMGEDSFFSAVFITCARSFGRMEDFLYHYDLGMGMSSSASAFTNEKFRRDMKSLSEAGEHMTEYLARYAPSYVEAAKKHLEVMHTYEYLMAVLYDDDLSRVIDNMISLKEMGYDKYYSYGVNRLLPERIGGELLGQAAGERTGSGFFELLTAIKDYKYAD